MVSIAGSLCLVLLCSTQVHSKPSSTYQEQYLNMEQRTDWLLASLLREPRMTPFWRTMGSKPVGAYCQQGVECTTKVCRKGHCSYLPHNWS
ncbi:liver-expressed antimicrobial peptide 2-like [Engystomops pustulosus]|uniref:liver-expressed antimicrobial peptide 2-like n=1 Tax=Engystomops pustulosus TaxID=76066 RepID=UPI003AFAE615